MVTAIEYWRRRVETINDTYKTMNSPQTHSSSTKHTAVCLLALGLGLLWPSCAMAQHEPLQKVILTFGHSNPNVPFAESVPYDSILDHLKNDLNATLVFSMPEVRGSRYFVVDFPKAVTAQQIEEDVSGTTKGQFVARVHLDRVVDVTNLLYPHGVPAHPMPHPHAQARSLFSTDSRSCATTQNLNPIEPGKKKVILVPPNTEPYWKDNEKQLAALGPNNVWKHGTGFIGDPTVVVAVIDSGVDYNHEDFVRSDGTTNLWSDASGHHGYDFHVSTDDPNYQTKRYDPMDEVGHGTWIAGVIGAVGDNHLGIAGINWRIQIMALKVLYSDPITDKLVFNENDMSQALGWLLQQVNGGVPVLVASNSWLNDRGGSSNGYDDVQLAYLETLGNCGVLCSFPAGNSTGSLDSVPAYPPCYGLDNIITAARCEADDSYDQAQTGYGLQHVELAAPGAQQDLSLMSAAQPGASSPLYTVMEGTSCSCAYVSGAAALLQGLSKSLGGGRMSPSSVIALIKESVKKLAYPWPNLVSTGGKLDIGEAAKNLIKAREIASLVWQAVAYNDHVPPGDPAQLSSLIQTEMSTMRTRGPVGPWLREFVAASLRERKLRPRRN